MAKNKKRQLSFYKVFSIFLSTLLFLFLLLISTEVFAQTTSTTTSTRLFRFPVSPNRVEIISGGEAPISDESVGLEALITVIETPAPGPPGHEHETWDWHYFNPAGVVVISTRLHFFADGADLGIPGGVRNCFFLTGSSFANCHVTSFSQIIQLNTRCTELGTFKVQLDHTPDGGVIGPITSKFFNVVPTGPATQVQLNPTTINPEIIGGGGGERKIPIIIPVPAGETTVTVTVTDAFCPNIPLEGATVALNQLSSTMVPGSGGHKHLIAEQPGLGEFSLAPGTGTTDQFGQTEVTYTAGIGGLEEDIAAKASIKDTLNNPIESTPENTGKARLTIKIGGLVPLPVVPQNYVLVGGVGEEGIRHVGFNHYGTIDMLFRVSNIARTFRELRTMLFGVTGVLRINDMSLPYGGVFDLNGLFTTAGDHVSHQVGVDVDISAFDSNLLPLGSHQLFLAGIARSIFGCHLIGTIHYRCIDGVNSRPAF